jgi:hypothetical protein
MRHVSGDRPNLTSLLSSACSIVARPSSAYD